MPNSRESQELTRLALGVLRAHPGQEMHYKDIAHELKYEKDPGNISTNLARVVRHYPDRGYRRSGANRSGYYCWRQEWTTEPTEEREPIPDMVEIMGFMADQKTMIVKDENGTLTLWRKVDLPDA